jgi:hypothetical protein
MESEDPRTMDWTAFEGVLPQGWRKLAEDMKLIRRNLPAHMGTKVTDISQILRLVFYQVGNNFGLELATAAFAAAGILVISFVALHKWMTKLGPYLQQLLAQVVLVEHARFAPERWAGYELIATDGSAVMRPGAKSTTARVHYALRLSDLRPVETHVTDEKGGETLRRFHPEQGQLWILDRGYANPPGIGHATRRKADVLVRYNRGALPLYDVNGRLLDVRALVAKLHKVDRPREWAAWVQLTEGKRVERIKGRLCAVRLPADKAEEARERIRREQAAEATAETLAMAEFVIVFTTVPRSPLRCELILALYRARWQIELEFKRDKSLTGLDRLPNFRPDTIESWICAKLLLHQILRKLCSTAPDGAFPPSAIADACIRPTSQAA